MTIDGGQRVTTVGTRIETVTIDGIDRSREVPDVHSDPDGAADTIIVRGSGGDDAFTLSRELGSFAATGRSSTDLKVARASSYSIYIGQVVRGEGDSVVVEAGDGNDNIDASSVDADVAQLVLRGEAGNDTLVGSRYNDVLDGGHTGVITTADGNDTFTGGAGRDTFFDAGGSDTLVESNDFDMGIYNNLFITGLVGASNVDFVDTVANPATVEDLKGIFETARLTGGNGAHRYLVGDADGFVGVGGARFTAQGWTGDLTLTTGTSADVVRVELLGATGARIHLTDNGGTADRLEVWGTSLREDLVVEKDSNGRGLIHQRSTGRSDDVVTIDHSGMDSVEIRTLSGSDRVAIRAIDMPHLVDLGDGDDVLAVGSNAAAVQSLTDWSNINGTVNNIAAGLTVVGGSGLDLATVDDTFDTLANTGELTNVLLTGLGLASAGISYSQLEDLRIALGSGNDTFTIHSTHGETGSVRSYSTSLRTNNGNDTVNIQTIDGPTTVDLGSGDNTVNVGSNAPTLTAGVLSHIAAFLTLTAGTGHDKLYVDDRGTTVDRVGDVTATRITGLGMQFNGSSHLPSSALNLPDLVQVVRVQNAISGRFRLTVAGFGTTSDLDFDAPAADVRDALEALNAGMVGNVVVTKAGGTWIIAYRGGLAGAAGWSHQISLAAGSTPLTAPASQTVTSGVTSMTDGWISYIGFDELDLGLGSGSDDLNIDTLPGPATVSTGAGDDVVMLETTAGATTINGQAGDDILVVNPIVDALEPNGLGGVLTLQGGFGSDYFIVGLWGKGDTRINVQDGYADSGNTAQDTNVLIVNGSPSNDTFLFRKGLIAQLTQQDDQGLYHAAEKVVYDALINGGVIVNGGDGDDKFAWDDTSTFMTVNGDGGNDRFYVGQILTDYDPNSSEFGIPFGTGLPGDTTFDANFFASTRGWLTNGVSNPVTINGGTGDDIFDIFRNKAVLTLNGEAGDDTFIIRTFVADSELTKVTSGAGRDLIQYAMNAPVAIDGGDGYDTVIVVGTEFADTFVITANGVYGAGRFVSFVNIERLVIDGMEGNDKFYVQSTNPNVETRIFGGLGSDTIEVAGHADTVQADDLLGHSGIVPNSVEAIGPVTGGLERCPSRRRGCRDRR